MKKSIPRGKISHSIRFDLKYLFKSMYKDLTNQEPILQFEKAFSKYVGLDFTITFPMARTAFYCILKSLDLEKGSKVLMPPVTIKGLLDVVLDLELVPIFADIDPISCSFSDTDIQRALAHKPKVALITYLFGGSQDIGPILRKLKSAGVFVVEDISQSLNAKYKNGKVGLFGDCLIYSSSPIKTLDTYGGGIFATRNVDFFKAMQEQFKCMASPSRIILFKKILLSTIRNLVTNRFVFAFTFPMYRLLTYFNPELGSRFVGRRSMMPISTLPTEWFCKFTSVQAEAGLEIIPKIENQDKLRTLNAQRIIKHSKYVHTGTRKNVHGVFWQNIVFVKNPAHFMMFMRKRGIDTAQSSLILLSRLSDYGISAFTPKAEFLYRHGVYLPCYSSLTLKDLTLIERSLETYPSELIYTEEEVSG